MVDNYSLTVREADLLLDTLGNYSLERIEIITRIIDSSNICESLDKWRNEDTNCRHPGGRPSVVNSRALLTLLLLLALDNRPIQIKTMAEIAIRRLDSETLAYLDLPEIDRDLDRWHDRLCSAMQRTLRIIDPKPLPDRRRRLFRDEFAQIQANRDIEAEERNQQRLNQTLNQLLEATWRTLPIKA